MAKRSKAVSRVEKNHTAASARVLPIARRGVKTATDFAQFMSAVMSDVIEGKLAPQVGNAACNAGGKLLKVKEMEFRYGHATVGRGPKRLALTE